MLDLAIAKWWNLFDKSHTMQHFNNNLSVIIQYLPPNQTKQWLNNVSCNFDCHTWISGITWIWWCSRVIIKFSFYKRCSCDKTLYYGLLINNYLKHLQNTLCFICLSNLVTNSALAMKWSWQLLVLTSVPFTAVSHDD